MHNWDDEWFRENGDDLYAAIAYIENSLRKHGIKVCGKEKWGCYQDEYLEFWDGSVHYFITNHLYWNSWIAKLFYTLDFSLIPIKKENEWMKIGFADFPLRKLVTKIVRKHQANMYNKVFQTACNKWSNVSEELLCDIEGYQMVKPGKWGDFDGDKVHRRHWKRLE